MQKDKGQLPIDVIQAAEQFEAAMANLAPIIGTYYKELKQNGIPDELAADLVLDWANIFWENQWAMKGSKL